MAAVGLAAGLLASWLAAESLAAMLYDVSVTDPSTFGGSVAVVALTAVLACYVPARRAARLDASLALRRA
jgi:putative ABC transport system permease protein